LYVARLVDIMDAPPKGHPSMRMAILRQPTEERRALILDGSLLRTMLVLSVPTLMLGFVRSLVPLMDGLFINNTAVPTVAGAVTFRDPIINMASAFAQGLSVAAMAILGQLNGCGSLERSRHTATQIVVTGSIPGCVSAPFLVASAAIISGAINHEISRDVFLYLALNAFVLPFSLAS
jgi:Na+-driven multidrug efflux pump